MMAVNSSPADYLAAAQAVVAQTADLLLETVGDVAATRKADGSLVTDADKAADTAICTSLAGRFPRHAILSEEGNTRYDPDIEYTWVVDPVDGTTNFARGLPLWGISVALLQWGDPLVGVLSFPLLGLTYTAQRHAGAQCNGFPLQTDASGQADDQHFIMCCTRTPRRYRVTTPLKKRMLGSAAYHIALVAEGVARAGIEATPKLWDVAAGLLVLAEAGGAYQLLQQSEPLFPLPAQPRDFRTYSLPILTAANRSTLNTVLAQIQPLPKT